MWYFEFKGTRYYFKNAAFGMFAVICSFLAVFSLGTALVYIALMGLYQLGGWLLILAFFATTLYHTTNRNGFIQTISLIPNKWAQTVITIMFITTGIISYIYHF